MPAKVQKKREMCKRIAKKKDKIKLRLLDRGELRRDEF